mgnify:CR=1 FL=1
MNYSPLIVTAYFVDCGLPVPVYEYCHIPGRKFRLDVAWVKWKIGIEVQGGLWIKAAHSTGKGIKRDMTKRNLSLLNGWRVLEVEPRELCMQATADMVHRLIQLASYVALKSESGRWERCGSERKVRAALTNVLWGCGKQKGGSQ